MQVLPEVKIIKNVFKDEEIHCDVAAETFLSKIKAHFMVVKEQFENTMPIQHHFDAIASYCRHK
jgi:hypothetical protein